MEKPFEESWFHAPLRAIGDEAWLDADESHHMRKVLRLLPGRKVVASNGLIHERMIEVIAMEEAKRS